MSVPAFPLQWPAGFPRSRFREAGKFRTEAMAEAAPAKPPRPPQAIFDLAVALAELLALRDHEAETERTRQKEAP